MLRYFPNLYEDELLYSAIARYHRHVANLGYKATLQDLFGSKTVCAVVDFPSHLNSLAKQVRPGNQDYAENLLINHTLYSYYTRFLSDSAAEKIKADMYGNDGCGIQTRVGIVAFKIRPPRFLKLCPQCATRESSCKLPRQLHTNS